MARLYLLRHGIAVPHGAPGVRQEDRPLTPEGEKEVGQVAKGLKRLKVEPDRVITSPLPRARRTAEIAAEVLGLADRLEHADVLKAGSPPEAIRDWLESFGGESLMLVGHNPDLTDLLGLLAGFPGDSPPFELKKAGVAALEGDGRGPYLIHWLATPKMIRRLLG
jgi:phosphohistidine phosphatase